MKLGTVSFGGKIYNLDNMKNSEVKAILDGIEESKTSAFKNLEELLENNSNDYSKIKEYHSMLEANIKSSAIVDRAYNVKTTLDNIDDKVKNEQDIVNKKIINIYPRYNDSNKNYDKINGMVSAKILEYEKNLTDIGNHYDNKIENLILEKVEVESSLCFALISKKYFEDKKNIRGRIKNNDKVRATIKESIMGIVDRFSKKKEEKKTIDPMMMSNLKDIQDIENELDDVNDRKYTHMVTKGEQIDLDIQNYREKILNIENSIKEINAKKIDSIKDAMNEKGNDALANISASNAFSEITKRFAIRLNLMKYIQIHVIDELEKRISTYKNDVLSKL